MIQIWASYHSYYCKYDDAMSKRDKFVALSLDLLTANRMTLDSVSGERGDPFDDVKEGSATEPCFITLTPAGAYVLTAEPMLLTLDVGKAKFSDFTNDMLLKCPMSEFTNLLISCGYSAELSDLQSKFMIQKYFIPVIANLVAGNNEAVKTQLQSYARPISNEGRKLLCPPAIHVNVPPVKVGTETSNYSKYYTAVFHKNFALS